MWFILLALYPSNKLEHLSYLLGALLEQQPGHIFSPQTILVENPGMQHWLNMELAQQKGIAMNLAFPLPTRFMWNTARAVLGKDVVPQQSAYRREVLVWRIENILRSDTFCHSPETEKACRYWQHLADAEEQGVQRLQFATALADIFEQYLLYRPDWLFSWEQGELVLNSEDEIWQSLIWRHLVAQSPLHPARLHKMAIDALQQDCEITLPARVIAFAINTMAPQLVQFFDALAKYTDIHIFHLNPSVNYWGDVKSDRERARLLRQQGVTQWQLDQQDNPLLANLGKQGRDLFNLLTSVDTFEISGFDVPAQQGNTVPTGYLHAVQQDILQATAPSRTVPVSQEDNSIIIARAHSSLREVQGLHDQLLHLMNNNSGIKPADVVVMCPAIEDYAPLIDAVFHRIGTPSTDNSGAPRVPCSIADRSPLDSEPLIASFISLLSLPDSRFEVSKIMDYLRLDALQAKFSLTSDDLDSMSYWLQQAKVHWGVDSHHKSVITHGATDSFLHSWSWGLKRLLMGMVFADEEKISHDILTVPDVEGQQTVVLGKLIHLLDQLGHYCTQLKKTRTPEQWREFLTELREACFSPLPEQQDTWETLERATADLEHHCREAGFVGDLSLRQVREVLLKRFSSPDVGNHFMTGQVTFCSMLPMRSIPFKVVCILGLNDGEFPRQSQPISIDLMPKNAARIGDRSRRMEDRYLFLEALISARDYLYLSYQGNSEKDNSERQPSLVLAELLDVLERGYGFDSKIQQRQLPLHPFSAGNFSADFISFEPGWYRLAESISTASKPARTTFAPLEEPRLPETVSVQQIARCLRHPLQYFANQVLGVRLDNQQPDLSDAEPFAESPLIRYQVMDALVNTCVEQNNTATVLTRYQLSGELPATPLTATLLERWNTASEALGEALALTHSDAIVASWQGHQCTVEAKAWTDGLTLKHMHVGKQHVQRLLSQFLTMLVFNASGRALPLEAYYLSWKSDKFTIRRASFSAFSSEEAQHLLAQYEAVFTKAHQGPYLGFADIAIAALNAAQDQLLSDWVTTPKATQMWQQLAEGQSQQQKGLNEDDYVKWFYPNGIALTDIPLADIEALFLPLMQCHGDKKR
ncbi:exodeoxyribonuclease V subunit gamma [Alteromonas pelagimontana]|uniref:RecBCD enzyme subunit RecC n=1 Tax=Alteromonas pelagimontana TaxID=1858656 RepID=A0A6M4MJS4_9ALTE|nr:exodeoxyribonuclease V subunit gamma [Alteromonas pelagimontana]QJR82336.1 exodeoxyribonuclease V subunit gamma [Alteromonas pelagimontana]